MVKDAREIPRAALAHVDDVEAELRGFVLEQARTAFGYKAESFGAAGPLAKALAALVIAPLDTTAVKQYMASKEREWRTHRVAVLHCTALVFVPILLWTAYWIANCMTGYKLFANGEPAVGWASGALFLGLLVFTMLSLVSNAVIDEHIKDFQHEVGWRRFTLGSVPGGSPYERYVPVHVLNLALQVQELVPGAVFYVDELQHIFQQILRALPDPFLSVELGAEKYFIAVWDEREFEAKL
jgi:hypothetical protein